MIERDWGKIGLRGSKSVKMSYKKGQILCQAISYKKGRGEYFFKKNQYLWISPSKLTLGEIKLEILKRANSTISSHKLK
jgi:hypothetical protein